MAEQPDKNYLEKKAASAKPTRVQGFVTPKYLNKIATDIQNTGASESAIVRKAVESYYDNKK